MPDNRNLHRNIFFRDCAHVPDDAVQRAGFQPSRGPVELDGRAAQGGQRAAGHLAQRQRERRLDVSRSTWTASDGRSTRPGRHRATATSAWSRSSRSRAQSETHPLLSPNDEFANYEIFSGLLGLPPEIGRIDHIHGSFARQALKDGITMQDVRGYNPYKFGMAAGSDSHNTGSPYRQDNFYGGHAEVDGTVETAHGRRPAGEHPRRAPGESRRTDRRVGRGEHPRLHLGRDVSQGDLRCQRPAHQGALLRRLGLQQGHPQRARLGASVLCERRPDGRRPASDDGGPGALRRSSSGR